MARLTRLRPLLLVFLLAGMSGCDRLVTQPSLYGTVTAEVRRRNGTPISGARLILYTGQRPMGYAVSDSLGRYVFEEVPEGMYGVLAVPPNGYERLELLLATRAPSEVIDRLRVVGGDALRASFQFLKKGPGTVTAQIRERDGPGIPGLTTILYGPRGEVRRAISDSSGTVSFLGVPFGVYGVIAERPAPYRDSGEVALPFVDGVIIEDGAHERRSFSFERCVGALTATVVDQTGRAVAHAPLVFYDDTTVLARDTTGTGGTRRYEALACKVYGVRVLPPRGYAAVDRRGNAYVDGIRIRRRDARSVTLTLQQLPRARVRVLVVDQESRPVAGTRVVLYTGEGLEGDERTGADGTLVFADAVAGPEYGLRVVPPPGYSVTEGAGLSYVDGVRLRADELREFTFTLQRRTP